MKIIFNNSQKLNEIIFANRNKKYGAYILRLNYNLNLFKSLSLVCLSILLFSMALYLYNKQEVNKPEVYTGTNESTKVVYFDTKPEEIFKPKENPSPKNPLGQKSLVLSTKISDTLKNEINSNVDNSNMNPNGSKTGEVNSNNSSGTGTNTTAITSTISATPEVTAFPAEYPEFEGGNQALLTFISKNMVYPAQARDANSQGTVYVSFVIDENGEVESAKVLKGIGYGCDEESIRVIYKIPKFKKPGRNTKGQAVKVIFNIPISFKLK